MAWVASSPRLQIPLTLASQIIFLAPLPHSPLLVLVSTTTVVIYDEKTLLPLSLHTRSAECLETHGSSTECVLRHVAVDSAVQEKMALVEVHVRTKSNFILVFQVAVNYGKSLYEVLDASNSENVLQNSLPLAATNAKNSLSSMFKTATRSLIHGATMGSNMASIEHFEHASVDDDQRNSYVPLVKIKLTRVLRLSAPILWFWCKPNSRNLIFFNGENQLQILNTRTFKSNTIELSGCGWYYDTVLLQYNENENHFLHVNSDLELSLLEFDTSPEASVPGLKHSLLAKLDSPAEAIKFNPQCGLVLIQTSQDLRLYALSQEASRKSWRQITTICVFSGNPPLEFAWSPCGEFFYYIDANTRCWKLLSKFGGVLFDSAHLASELAASSTLNASDLDAASDFCKISACVISSNAQNLHVINMKAQTLYKINLMRLAEGPQSLPLFYNGTYISRLDTTGSGAFVRVPVPPFMQRVTSDLQWINGLSLKKTHKKPTGILAVRSNRLSQISMSYGHEISISTPVSMGSECNQTYWYQFYNHFLGSMNIVDHIWVEDYLLVVNRYPREDSVPDSGSSSDLMVDELILMNTRPSKNGPGGEKFKFDSDIISWRHTFKNRILRMTKSESTRDALTTLTLVTHDMKVIIIDFDVSSISLAESPDQTAIDSSKISIKVRRTIHLSSIKHKLSLSSVKDMLSVGERHFFFLLDNGDLFLLKNQLVPANSLAANGSSSRTQTNNMYDLVKINTAVERIQIYPIKFEENKARQFLALYKCDSALTYDLDELLDRPNSFEGVEKGETQESMALLKPVTAQTAAFTSICISQANGSIGISGFEYHFLWKNEFLIVKHRVGRWSILDKFVQRDLFEAGLDKHVINQKYSLFSNYAFCLELLLFQQLEYIEDSGSFDKVCDLVNANEAADTIYVNFLRKIEIHYWKDFFGILKLTPIEFMTKLISSQNVDLCYNYLSIYLNFKKEHERADSPGDPGAETGNLLEDAEQSIILEIVALLKKYEKWDECFELCRYIKLLQPSGNLLRRVRTSIAT